jgi:GTP-binding protein
MQIEQLRNIAIIAHVDHGKTTLVDKMLQQSGTLGRNEAAERVMDSNDIEKERGITILAKNTAINWGDYRINIVDTPGHADFGGEVERIMTMVDSVLLLVDAVDGPMPQTRFVTQKAFEQGLHPIVVVNKIDRDGARPDWVVDQIFDLFDKLGATDEQLDFPIIYASAIEGIARNELTDTNTDLNPLFEAIAKHVSPPNVQLDGPFQMQISALDYSSYVGTIGIGRITRGTIKRNTQITIVDKEGKQRSGKILQLMNYIGLNQVEVEEAQAGEIITVNGIDKLNISDTLCDKEKPEALPALSIDEPTVTMTFQVNTSPFAGKEGKYVTSRQIRDRLERELLHNVALRVDDSGDPDKFRVSGRGELHLSVLIETMRREGFELAVSRPQVITREIDGVKNEPFESVVIDVEEQHQGPVMEALGAKKADLKNMVPDGKGRVRLEYIAPTRALIGFRSDFLTMTSGSGIMHHVFEHYAPERSGKIINRHSGALIANGSGTAVGFALWGLQERGRMFIKPQTPVYEGMVIGWHARENDLVVNATREKKLTNVRASGTDESIVLVPPIRITLEYALESINDDELVEVTPTSIRVRKRFLLEHERKKASREG